MNSILKVHGWSGPFALLAEATQIDREIREFARIEGLQGGEDTFGEDIAALGVLPHGVVLDSELDDKGFDSGMQVAMAIVLFVGSTGAEWLIEGFLDRLWMVYKDKISRLLTAVKSKEISSDHSAVAIQICHVKNGSLLEVKIALSSGADAPAVLSQVEGILRAGAENISLAHDVVLQERVPSDSGPKV